MIISTVSTAGAAACTAASVVLFAPNTPEDETSCASFATGTATTCSITTGGCRVNSAAECAFDGAAETVLVLRCVVRACFALPFLLEAIAEWIGPEVSSQEAVDDTT